jgi:hypothetical protein
VYEKNKSQRLVRATSETPSPTKKLQWSTALDDDTTNENHVIHKTTAGKINDRFTNENDNTQQHGLNKMVADIQKRQNEI